MFKIEEKCPYCKNIGILAKLDMFGFTFTCEKCLTMWNTNKEELRTDAYDRVKELYHLVKMARENRELTES